MAGHPRPCCTLVKKNVDGRDKPGHDEKSESFSGVKKSLKILDTFWVIDGAQFRILPVTSRLRPERLPGAAAFRIYRRRRSRLFDPIKLKDSGNRWTTVVSQTS
jgi:hypothetical protein